MNFAKTLPVRMAIAVLLLQLGTYYAVASRSEHIPSLAPLENFPSMVREWRAVGSYPLEPGVAEVLKADDTLNRLYVDPTNTAKAFLFVAFFKTQRYGQAPHSPKNCLPGSGWMPRQDRLLPLNMPGRSTPIVVNEYVVSRGEDESVVLYWYQSHSRVIARELAAKFWLVADAVRYHRSDTALVRIVVPVLNNDTGPAEKTAENFARTVYPDLVKQLPQ